MTHLAQLVISGAGQKAVLHLRAIYKAFPPGNLGFPEHSTWSSQPWSQLRPCSSLSEGESLPISLVPTGAPTGRRSVHTFD